MYRLATLLDEWDIQHALFKLKNYADKYDWAFISVDHALAAVSSEIAAGNAWIISGHLVLVQRVIPWYSDRAMLQEYLVLKLGCNGVLADVPVALQAIALEQGCVAVITGDSSPLSIVADAYKAAGFSPLTRSFYKKVG